MLAASRGSWGEGEAKLEIHVQSRRDMLTVWRVAIVPFLFHLKRGVVAEKEREKMQVAESSVSRSGGGSVTGETRYGVVSHLINGVTAKMILGLRLATPHHKPD